MYEVSSTLLCFDAFPKVKRLSLGSWSDGQPLLVLMLLLRINTAGAEPESWRRCGLDDGAGRLVPGSAGCTRNVRLVGDCDFLLNRYVLNWGASARSRLWSGGTNRWVGSLSLLWD